MENSVCSTLVPSKFGDYSNTRVTELEIKRALGGLVQCIFLHFFGTTVLPFLSFLFPSAFVCCAVLL